MAKALARVGLATGLLLLALRLFEAGVLPAPVYRKVRRFNRRVVNPVALRLAVHQWAYYGVVRHTGRRSGRAYATPVVLAPAAGGFVVPLTYGPGVDWCRNVLAAGGCRVGLSGRDRVLVAPRVVAADDPLEGVGPVWRALFRLAGVRWFLHLQQDGAATSR